MRTARGLAIVLCLLAPAASGCAEEKAAAGPVLPVLCYHGFGEEKPGDAFCFSAERFEGELQWLRQEGYRSVTLAQVRAFCAGEFKGLPEKPVCITIDDGFRSGLTIAAPLLEGSGFGAVFFVVTDQVGVSKKYLDYAGLKELRRRGFEIGLHSASHGNLAKRKKGEDEAAYRERLEREINRAKKALEKGLGEEVKAMSYPYGAYNSGVAEKVEQAGCDLAFSVTDGANSSPADPFRVRRMLLQGPVSLKSFEKRVSRPPLDVRMTGLTEGGSITATAEPVQVCLSSEELNEDDTRIEFQGNDLPLTWPGRGKDNVCVKLPAAMKPGFYLLKVRNNFEDTEAGQDYLFQVTK